jgi:UDP-glucose 4-epimerase
LPGVVTHEADLLEKGERERLFEFCAPSHFLHMAWCTAPIMYWQSPDNFRWLEASAHLASLFVKHGGSRFIGVGTCAEYDWKQGLCSELSTLLSNATPYARCKNAFHGEIRRLNAQTGLPYCWARMFFPYGRGESPQKLISSAMVSLADNREFVCKSGDLRRDYIYADDVAEALVRLLTSSFIGSMNIGTGLAPKISDIVFLVAEKLGRTRLVRMMDSESLEPPLVVADTTRLTTELGWHPSWSLDMGVARMIEEFRAGFGNRR